MCGAEVASVPHPDSGARDDVDEILGFTDANVIPAGHRENPFAGYDFEEIASSVLRLGIATGGPGGLTAEFPIGTSDEVERDPGPWGVGPTSLYQQMPDVPHPTYGGGLFSLLSVPLVGMSEDQVLVLANDLNRAEATELTGFPAWGAWVPHASSPGRLAHVAFIPGLLADPGVPATLAFHAFHRSHWVAEQIRGR
jgi:hypothetical protein